MKQLFTSLFLISCTLIFGQNLSLAYEITSKPNKNDKSFVETSLCLLDVNGGTSYFYSPLMNNPQKQIEIIAKNQNLQEKVLKNLTTYIIKKNIAKNTMTHYFKFDETFAYSDNIPLKWEIKNGTTEILGYQCREASAVFRGRTYTAYYTKEIPVSDGPYKFHGLPGLILKVTSNDGDYDFTAIAIEKKNEDLDFELGNAVATTRAKFLSEMKKLAEEPSKNQKLRDKANGFQYRTKIDGKEVSNAEKYAHFDKMIWNFMKTHNNPIETDDIWIR